MELFPTPDNPLPPGAILSAIRTPDGLNLRVARWVSRASRGTVTIFPGRAEFIEKYFEVVGELLARHFDVVVMDWRGQGLSDRELANPRKGHIDDFTICTRDVDALVQQVLESFCPKPWFAIGHSMGGAILTSYLHDVATTFDRAVLTAPMIDICFPRFRRGAKIALSTLGLAGLGRFFIPGGGVTSVMSNPFEDNVLTSDRARFARMAQTLVTAPQLGIGAPTIGWLNAAFRLMRLFERPDYARRISTPVLVLASGADTVVRTPTVELFASRLKAGSVITIPGARHEIMMERDPLRDQFWAAFDAFVPGEAEGSSIAAEIFREPKSAAFR